MDADGECLLVILEHGTMIATVYEILRGDREFDEGSCSRFGVVWLISTYNEQGGVRHFLSVVHGGCVIGVEVEGDKRVIYTSK